MADFNVIDSFLQTFVSYIDSGFGLLSGDVAGLASLLIGIDVTLAALFWLYDRESDIFARLIKKVLYVGAFAFIINNFSSLATIVFNSFSRLGLDASANAVSPEDLLQPGKLAGTGYQAAWPLLEEAGKLIGFSTVFSHLVTIAVLVGAWFIVVIAFFILAIQLFVTILEFKLTTLAGFVLVPFALWNKTSFLAERVLGNVIASAIKVMVLAVIIGIGSGFFAQFIGALATGDPTLAQAMTLVLAALCLLGLGIFGPSVAAGVVSGGPQLGAGAALGTMAAFAGATGLAGTAGSGAARVVGRGALAAVRAGTALTAAGSDAGSNGAGQAFGARAAQPLPSTDQTSFTASSPSSGPNSGGTAESGGGSSAPPPAWARRLRAEQTRRSHAQSITQAVRDGDHPTHGALPDLDP